MGPKSRLKQNTQKHPAHTPSSSSASSSTTTEEDDKRFKQWLRQQAEACAAKGNTLVVAENELPQSKKPRVDSAAAAAACAVPAVKKATTASSFEKTDTDGPTPPDSPPPSQSDTKRFVPSDDAAVQSSEDLIGTHGRYGAIRVNELSPEEGKTAYSVFRRTDDLGNQFQYVVLPDTNRSSLTCEMLRCVDNAREVYPHDLTLRHIHCSMKMARLLALHQCGEAGGIHEAFSMDIITAALQTSRLVLEIHTRLCRMGSALGYELAQYDDAVTAKLGPPHSYKQYQAVSRVRKSIETSITYAAMIANDIQEYYPMPQLGDVIVDSDTGEAMRLVVNKTISGAIEKFERNFDRVLPYISKPHARIATMARRLADLCFDALALFRKPKQNAHLCRFQFECMIRVAGQLSTHCRRLTDRCHNWMNPWQLKADEVAKRNLSIPKVCRRAFVPPKNHKKSSDDTESDLSDDTDADDFP